MLNTILLLLLLFLVDRPSDHQGLPLSFSVANTAVYLLNWATLKSPAAGQKPMGGWPKIGLRFICSSFLFKFASFLSIQGVLSLFLWPIMFFSSISIQIWEIGHTITVTLLAGETSYIFWLLPANPTYPFSDPPKIEPCVFNSYRPCILLQ